MNLDHSDSEYYENDWMRKLLKKFEEFTWLLLYSWGRKWSGPNQNVLKVQDGAKEFLIQCTLGEFCWWQNYSSYIKIIFLLIIMTRLYDWEMKVSWSANIKVKVIKKSNLTNIYCHAVTVCQTKCKCMEIWIKTQTRHFWH